MELKFYKCESCGKVIAMIKGSPCGTVCCGSEMVEIKAGTSDGAIEKHVPVLTVSGSKVDVAVGAVAHPMMEKHYIEWIALETNQGFQLKSLQPEQEPKASFALSEDESVVKAYAYCNLHGLWASN